MKQTYTTGKWSASSGVHCWVIRAPFIAYLLLKPSWWWRVEFNWWKA